MSRLKPALRGMAGITVGVVVIIGILLASPNPMSRSVQYGVSFSQTQADWLAGDWREVYRDMLEDLKVKKLRINAYWDLIEQEQGRFDFSDLDWQMDMAAERGAKVVLSVGRKLPRWPECHIPRWAEGLSEAKQQKEVYKMLGMVIKRYKDHPALVMWQLENEPFLDFGKCPPEDEKFLAQEEQLLRESDKRHSILITDSGELNWWLKAARYGDVMGTTMYRAVYSQRTKRLFHYDYIFPAWLYRVKARIVYLVRGKRVIISELQGEPWGSEPYIYLREKERRDSFSPDKFVKMKRFAERTQLPEAYWWGVEYWWWEKEQGNSEYWELAKSMM